MGERAGLLANKITASKDLRYEQAQKLIKFDEIVVRGDGLIIKSLWEIVQCFSATIDLFLPSSTVFFQSSLYWGSFTLYKLF